MENTDTQKTCEPPSSGSPLPRLVVCLLNNTLPSALGAIILGAMIEPLLAIDRPGLAVAAGVGAGLMLGWWAGMAAIVFVSRSPDNA